MQEMSTAFQIGVVQTDMPVLGNIDAILALTRTIRLKGEKRTAPHSHCGVKYSLDNAPIIVPAMPLIKRDNHHFVFLFCIIRRTGFSQAPAVWRPVQKMVRFPLFF